MADGDVIQADERQLLVNLLDARTTVGAFNGVWVDVSNWSSGYLIATGLVGGDAIVIDASNDAAKPANTAHGAVLSAAVTNLAPTLAIAVLPRYIKAQITQKLAGAAVTFALQCHGP